MSTDWSTHLSKYNRNVVKLASGMTHLMVHGSDSPNAETVLFIHGAGLSGRIWQPLIDGTSICRRYETIMYDIEGHGLSPWEGGAKDEFLVEKWARTAKEVLDYVGADKAYIVGHDIGAVRRSALSREVGRLAHVSTSPSC